MDRIAPIVLFVYNRLEHTKKTVEALQNNSLAKDSELYIYCDAPKDKSDEIKTNEVKEYVEVIDGFKKITIIKRDRNWGLADSIIDGVTEIVKKYGKIIVLEDDIVTSPFFLTFMNNALEFYKNEKNIWHISGWNYPIVSNSSSDVFIWRLMNCWGWATWSENWIFFEKDPEKLHNSFSKSEIKDFNLNNYENFFDQVKLNLENKKNTWAIFWYATIFKNKALCVNPQVSYVNNIGFDSSGENCGNNSIYTIDMLNQKSNAAFENSIIENKYYLGLVQMFYKNQKKNIFRRSINKIKSIKVIKE